MASCCRLLMVLACSSSSIMSPGSSRGRAGLPAQVAPPRRKASRHRFGSPHRRPPTATPWQAAASMAGATGSIFISDESTHIFASIHLSLLHGSTFSSSRIGSCGCHIGRWVALHLSLEKLLSCWHPCHRFALCRAHCDAPPACPFLTAQLAELQCCSRWPVTGVKLSTGDWMAIRCAVHARARDAPWYKSSSTPSSLEYREACASLLAPLTSASRPEGQPNQTSLISSADFTPMAPRSEARLVEDLRDFLDDFAFRAKRLAAPLLRPFGPTAEPAAVDDAELDMLKAKLRRIRATLRAAEDRVVADEFVALWLRELRDLEHAAEDVLEELEFEALRSARLEGFKAQLLRSSSAAASKRKREISLMYSSSPDRLSRKIAKIMERYNEIARDRDALRLRSGDGDRRQEVSPMTPTSCLMKCRLHGREPDLRRVTELLLSDEAKCGDVYSVVPIVGPAGVGKTALAQHIYNDEAISAEFDIKMWVWVCQEFDVLKLTRKLVEEATESPCDFADMNQMHRVISDRLKGKRFLLVLDDVWDESRDRWSSLQVPLKCAVPGSKIVVTTRSTKVARMMALKMHKVGYLSDTNCWSVCQDAALRGRDPSIINESLLSIGKSVAARCKGLPLAANAVGHVLSIAIDRNHWEAIEQSDLWSSEVVEQIIPTLLVSYNSLQKHLKLCFSYCSLFPKEYLFRKDKLVRLWLAQGFVEADSEHHAEDIACKYFDDLVEKFFLQRLPYTEGRYVMHDLYHELAEYVSAKEYSRIEKSSFSNVEENARHLSVAPCKDHCNETVQFYALQNEYMKESRIPGLRTLLVVQNDELEDKGNTLHIKFPSGMFKLLGSLRSLDLSNTSMEHLPHSVGELIHLRYLSLENTKIKCLPESISCLFKLHSMNLKCCNSLIELPKGIKFLTNLRHLELPSMDDWNIGMPCGIGELTNLQTMHAIKVGGDSGSCGIADLVNLNKLRGELCVSGIENVTSAQITPEASIKNKGQLRKLILHWSSIDSMFSDEASPVLDSLQPHPDLEELTIRGFSGIRFPLWLGNQYMFSLSVLELKDCRNCKELPSLGQLPCLKHLSINSLPSIKHVRRMLSVHGESNCSDYRSSTSRAFPTLETLKFANMDSWELWDEIEATDFPCLQHLTIMRCSKLSRLPNLQALQNLRIKNCEALLELPSFPSLQCIKIQGFWSVSQILLLPILATYAMRTRFV